jgi:hypothetical protein
MCLSHNEKQKCWPLMEMQGLFGGTAIALYYIGAAISPREHQRFVPKQGRAAETVGPPNARLQR